LLQNLRTHAPEYFGINNWKKKKKKITEPENPAKLNPTGLQLQNRKIFLTLISPIRAICGDEK
jgi:hypothetical protein